MAIFFLARPLIMGYKVGLAIYIPLILWSREKNTLETGQTAQDGKDGDQDHIESVPGVRGLPYFIFVFSYSDIILPL
jgi:hypothetical protein